MIYMPHPGHFICSQYCRFFLNTYVNGYIVRTVGEYVPSEAVREAFAQSRGFILEGRGDARESDYIKKSGTNKLELTAFMRRWFSKLNHQSCYVVPIRFSVTTISILANTTTQGKPMKDI